MNTKSTFKTVAAIIAKAAPDTTPSSDHKYDAVWISAANLTRYKIAQDLASHFAAENPRFDRARFMAACEVS